MSLEQKIQDEMKAAMKSREADRLMTLRNIISDLKYARIENGGVVDDALVEKVLRKMSKQRKESIESYRSGAREDLAAKEEAELVVIEGFLPAQIDDETVAATVKALAAELGVSAPSDFGKLMKASVAKFGGAVDGKRIQAAVKAVLG